MTSKEMTEMFTDLLRSNGVEGLNPDTMYNARALFTVVEVAIDRAIEKIQKERERK